MGTLNLDDSNIQPSDDLVQRIAGNLAELQAQIDQALQTAGRQNDTVKLVAVSKTVGLTEIAAAIFAGQMSFAENRTSLFKERQAVFATMDWHFIGRIQTNKIKDFTGKAALVHSVASEKAMATIARQAEQLGVVQPVLIEVNTTGEQSKDGVTPQALPALLATAASFSSLRVDGLMTMAPIADEPTVHRCFADLKLLQLNMQEEFVNQENLPLSELSMGMSDDFVIAILEGATIIRLGRSVWR